MTKQYCANSALLSGFQQLLFIKRMRARFTRCKKTCAHHGCLRTQSERRHQPAPITDASRRNDRRRCDRIDHARHQYESRHLACNVTTGFNALRNDYINSRTGGGYCVCDRADLMKNLSARCMDTLHVGRWIAPEERKHGDMFFKTDRNEILAWKMQNEIDAKRLLSEFANTLKLAAKQRRRAKLSLENSKSARVSNCCNQLRACEIRTHWRSDDRILNSQRFAQFRPHGSVDLAWSRAS